MPTRPLQTLILTRNGVQVWTMATSATVPVGDYWKLLDTLEQWCRDQKLLTTDCGDYKGFSRA